MNEVLFEVLKSVVVLLVILITSYAIPYIRQLVENTKYAWVVKWVDLAVKSAEQTIFKSGADKKAIVTDCIKRLLIRKNIDMTDEQIDILIESAVFEMNRGKNENR